MFYCFLKMQKINFQQIYFCLHSPRSKSRKRKFITPHLWHIYSAYSINISYFYLFGYWLAARSSISLGVKRMCVTDRPV